MKKMLLTLGSFTMVASIAVLTTSCTYIDVVEKSINNRITQAASTTAHFFKGAILTNSYKDTDNEIDGRKVDEFIYKSKAMNIMPGSNELSSMKQIFSTYFDMSNAEDSATKFIDNKYKEIGGDFYIPPSEGEETSFVDLFKTIKSLFDQLNSLIGQGFSPSLVDQIIPILLDSLGIDNDLNETFLSLSSININNLHVPTEDELRLTVTEGKPITYSDVQFFFLINLNRFLASSFGYDKNKEPTDWTTHIINEGKWNEKIVTTYDQYYEYTSKLFTYIINGLTSDDSNIKFAFHNQDVQILLNAIFGLSWYIDAFDKYRQEDSTQIVDDNHIFNKNYTNNEVFSYVKSQPIEYDKLGNEIDGLLSFFVDIFSNESDKYSYNTTRVLKILFQVNYGLDNAGNERLDPDYNGNLGILQLKYANDSQRGLLIGGSWGAGYENFENGLSPLIISLCNGLLKSNLIQDLLGSASILLFPFYDELSSGIGNLLSSMLANVDLTRFMDDFFNSWIGQLLKDTIPNEIIDILVQPNGIGNRLFHQLMNGDLIGKIIDSLNQDAEPSMIRNLKDIFNFKIGGIVSISDIATVLLNIIAAAPDLAVKVFNLFDTISSTKYADAYTNGEQEFWNTASRKVTLEEITSDITNPTDLAIAIKLLDDDFVGVGFDIVTSKGTTKRIYGKDASFYILGLVDKSFKPNTILYNIAELYNDGSGEIVKGLFNTIDSVLTSVDNLIGEKEKETWDVYLQSNRWSVWIVDFENFEDISKRSSLTYNIQYRDQEYNIDNTYQVVLSLNGDATIKADSTTKYVIESFEKL